MAPRHSSPAEEDEQEQEVEKVTLQFNETLTWRPGKPISIDVLLKRLDRLSKELGEMEQEAIDPNSLTKVAKEVASHQLLSHKDKGVRAYTACCVVDILRLCAPDAPFTPSQLKDIFNLTVTSIIPALFDPSNPYNNQHKYVLRSFAEIKSVVLLLDVEGSEDLLLRLFSTIFDGVSGASKSASAEQIGKDVEFSMQEVLGILIDDATSLPANVVDVIMAQFLRAAAPGGSRHIPIDDNQATLLLKEEPEAYQMAKSLCQSYPEKMARFVSQYFSDVIVDATSFAGRPNNHKDREDSDDDEEPSGPSESDLRELKKAHTLIREIWKAAPQILQNVVPQVDAELSADNVHLRQLATETLGDMISGIGAAGPPPPPTLDPTLYPPLKLEDDDRAESPVTNILTTPLSAISFSQTHNGTFNSFISRKNDKAPSIRAAWTTAVGYILSTSAGGIGLSREDEASLIRGLGEKLSDNDEKVRLAAVKAIESFRFQDVVLKLALQGGVSKEGSVLSTLADRCRDRKPAVRVQAMSLLAKLWAAGTGEMIAGNDAVVAALSGVPTRIINAFYANDRELNVLLDRVLYELLIPLGYPPSPKKGAKNSNSNGNSQSQASVAPPLDQDAIRAERILLLVRSLDQGAKKAFYAMQGRQPQFAKVVDTYITHCLNYNGGVMDSDADKKTSVLNQTATYLATFLPDELKSKNDLIKFAKINDRRNYNLIRYVIGQEHDFKTVHKALRELIKRIQSSKEPQIVETWLPLLYRSGSIIFNRSHLSTIMDYSKSDKDGMGAAAHEILNEISQRNPDLFKTHIGQLCKDLVDQAPSATKENDPIVAETLKACSTYARKYPKDVPMNREFVQTMISYALYGQPAKCAKYAVNILLSKKDDKSMVSATDLLQRTFKDFTYGSPHFLNKLATVSQLELLAPKVTEEYEDKILNIAVQQLLLQVRTGATAKDPSWVEDADMDEECQAKCLALKILANRLRSMEDIEEAKDKARSVWKLFRKVIKEHGEICKTADTPKHHKARLWLLSAQLMLKLCTLRHFDDILSPEDFNLLAFTAQAETQEVRHGFVRKLQKYLADGKLRTRFYTIIFLTAFEPNTEFKNRTETWVRSRARHFKELNQPVLEATLARLLSLLAHHPDYSPELDDLVDHARYILYYVELVATEKNLGLIYKYAERVKQTADGLNPASEAHRVLSDLAQAVIRKWQEKKNWVFSVYAGKVGLPVGLYTALSSHKEAQEMAEKQFVPGGIDEKLDELLRAMDRKKVKKRKTSDDRNDGSSHPAKRSKSMAHRPKEASSKPTATTKKSASSSAKAKKSTASKTPSRKKTKSAAAGSSSPAPMDDKDRRRSGRARANQSYIERDSDEDDEEMIDGVAEWTYENEVSGEEEEDGEESGSASGSGGEEAEEEGTEQENDETKEDETPAKKNQRKELSPEPEPEVEEEKAGEDEPEEEAQETLEPAPKRTSRGGRKAPPPSATKAKPAKGRATRKSKQQEEEEESELSELSDVEMEAPPDEEDDNEKAKEVTASPAAEEEEPEAEAEDEEEEAPPSAKAQTKRRGAATAKATNGRKAKPAFGSTDAAATTTTKKGNAKAAAAPTRSTRATRGSRQQPKSAAMVDADDDMDEDE